MKAMTVTALDNMVVKEVADPTIDKDGILVKVKTCAVCGSDIRIFHHGNNRVEYPAIIGHEIAGEVVAVGENVTRFAPGDRIAIGADVPCGECEACEAGDGNNCEINYAIGYQFPGGFAEYIPLNRTVVNYGPLHQLPDHVSYEEGSLAEPLGCVLNALEKTPVKLGDTVVVIGAGPIGCMMTNVIAGMGTKKVIMIQRSKARLEIAKKIVKADVFICSAEEDPVKRVLEETGGKGANVVITACASGLVQQQALEMAAHHARINFFGGLAKGSEMVTLNTNLIHYKELLVTGSHGATPAQHRRAVDLIASGAVDVKPFISKIYGLDDIEEAFRFAESHEGMRVIVKPEE